MEPAPLPLGFELDQSHVASEPPEVRGLARDGVRLMVSSGDGEPVHATFHDLRDFLTAGDLVVVNTSA
ncbi:MAG: S-adenosylmethionine:tRNA ribosyltransferase-isomerase, partial [Actinomycetota bacterium]|nr:S-adenosylmethionine:tRNA ribosyltransferase-isomerase [Actinomycetota bacterium]